MVCWRRREANDGHRVPDGGLLAAAYGLPQRVKNGEWPWTKR